MTSGLYSFWFLLVMKQRIFFQVMAILCWAAKKSLRGSLFLGALFTKVICIFDYTMKDGFFDAPFDLFKEKKFSSPIRGNELFGELKRSKMEETAQNFKKRFL